MKTKIIEFMEMAGYDFIKEQPENRLLFYDTDDDQNVQFWINTEKTEKQNFELIIALIKDRARDKGISIGKSTITSGIKKLLQL